MGLFKRRQLNKREKFFTFLEFLLVGLVMGITEDLLAVKFATDAELDAQVVIIVIIIAVPFAVISEFLVDHPLFWSKIFGNKK